LRKVMFDIMRRGTWRVPSPFGCKLSLNINLPTVYAYGPFWMTSLWTIHGMFDWLVAGVCMIQLLAARR